MAKKKLTSKVLIEHFMNYVLSHGEQPKNVYIFMNELGYKEADFYPHFGSFEAIEQEIFTTFFTHTITLLEKNEDYMSFDAKNRLLSFYFTYFEMLTANRSYVKQALSGHQSPLKRHKALNGLRKKYMEFVVQLEIKTIDLKIDRAEDAIQRGLHEVSWRQFLFILKYWMNDSSPNFEKTDILIEKTMNTGFEILNTSPLESIVDLGKFLIKETFNKK